MYPADYAEYIMKNWRPFIDDCFLIWNNQYHIGDFFDMLNNLDDNIKFTMEKHTDKLPFLDSNDPSRVIFVIQLLFKIGAIPRFV